MVSVRKKPPSGAAAGIIPRIDGFGNPLQTDRNGLCKRQGCEFPRRIDESTGKVFDYCGKTCAKRDSGIPTAATGMLNYWVCVCSCPNILTLFL